MAPIERIGGLVAVGAAAVALTFAVLSRGGSLSDLSHVLAARILLLLGQRTASVPSS